MANERLTEWYPGKIKPVRSGVYERKIPGLDYAVFSYFDVLTGVWGMNASNKFLADSCRHLVSTHQNEQWRGMHKRSSDND